MENPVGVGEEVALRPRGRVGRGEAADPEHRLTVRHPSGPAGPGFRVQGMLVWGFTGQVISVSGTWMQMVAQTYLILFPLHGTGVDVAIAAGLQFVPLLLFGPFGGLIADRLDKRKVLYVTQSSAGVLAWPGGVRSGEQLKGR